jgi:formate-dependent nitrite reductase membrane component NrfD
MPDTFFTSAPEWTIYIIPYFFVGGIAGGCYFLASLLHWLGRPEDQRIARMAYVIAAIGAVLSGLLLVVDLGQPLRFWHMIFQSERFPRPILKAWSPMSIGSWALLFFGLFATLSAIGALAYDNRYGLGRFRFLYDDPIGRVIAVLGGVCGFFMASYTGVLLSVTNRPIWADTQWLGVLFLASAASTAAATIILATVWRMKTAPDHPTVAWLNWFDGWVLILELVLIAIFLVSLGEVARVWLSWRGILLVVLVVFAGILVPLMLHFRPAWFSERWRSRRLVTAAVLVLIGGFFLRFVTLLSSETIHVPQSGLQGPQAGVWP